MGSFSVFFIFSLILIMGISDVVHGQDSPVDYVNAHNAARSEIRGKNIPNIIWDDSIAAFAQNYANQRKDCKVIPSGGDGGRYGENLALSTSKISGTEAVKLWVDEKINYDIRINGCKASDCYRFTQVVWKNSTHVGCAKVNCDNGGTFVTCNYSPPGNIIGQKPF